MALLGQSWSSPVQPPMAASWWIDVRFDLVQHGVRLITLFATSSRLEQPSVAAPCDCPPDALVPEAQARRPRSEMSLYPGLRLSTSAFHAAPRLNSYSGWHRPSNLGQVFRGCMGLIQRWAPRPTHDEEIWRGSQTPQ